MKNGVVSIVTKEGLPDRAGTGTPHPDKAVRMAANATEAANFLKAISHEGRLMILCHLITEERSVTQLEELIAARQSAVSQQLARLRLEGLVVPRREGKVIYYNIADGRVRQVLALIHELFCR